MAVPLVFFVVVVLVVVVVVVVVVCLWSGEKVGRRTGKRNAEYFDKSFPIGKGS